MAGLDFNGKTVWVTGAGKRDWLYHGAGVCCGWRAGDGIGSASSRRMRIPLRPKCWMSPDTAQVAQVCRRVLAQTERLDVLVNAAGICGDRCAKREDWQQTFVNVGGAFNLFQQTMAQFRQRQGGAITVASDAAHTPRVGMSACLARPKRR